MDDYFIINEDRGTDERNVTARFEMHPQLHSAKSQLAGRPVYVDTPLVYIRVRDDETGSKIPHMVTEEHKRRFPKQWAEFEAAHREPESGTPLRMWAAITPAKLKEFTAAGLLTVEAVADAKDAQIGPEAGEWRERARKWLNPNAELDNLRRQLAERDAEIALLNSPEKRGPGRPRKDAA